jgi:hypothetical protein
VPAIPPPLPILLYAGMGLLIWRWAAAAGWSDQFTLALTSGALLTYMLCGFRLSARGRFADVIVHRVVCVVIAWLLVRLFSRHAHAREHGAGRLVTQAATRPKSSYEHQEASGAKPRKQERGRYADTHQAKTTLRQL